MTTMGAMMQNDNMGKIFNFSVKIQFFKVNFKMYVLVKC